MRGRRDEAGDVRPVGAVIVHRLPAVFQNAFRLARMEKEWPDVVGPQLAPRTLPAKIESGGLVVYCETPATAQMLLMCAGTVQRRIERRYGVRLKGVKAVVRHIVRPRRRAQSKPKPLVVPEAKVRETYERVSESVKDPDVALALARLEATARARFGEGRGKEASKSAESCGKKSP